MSKVVRPLAFSQSDRICCYATLGEKEGQVRPCLVELMSHTRFTNLVCSTIFAVNVVFKASHARGYPPLAYSMKSCMFVTLQVSLICRRNELWPSVEPCGTPHVAFCKPSFIPLSCTDCDLFSDMLMSPV